MPTRGASGGQLKRRRGSGRATVRPMTTDPSVDPTSDPSEPSSTFDLLTIGLLVFFLSLLGIVAALLALPMILG
jgi:hypothetical protein